MSHCKNDSCGSSLSDCGLLLLLLFLAVLLLVFGPALGALIAALVLAVIYIIAKLCCFC
jgi:hypothetical protein